MTPVDQFFVSPPDQFLMSLDTQGRVGHDRRGSCRPSLSSASFWTTQQRKEKTDGT